MRQGMRSRRPSGRSHVSRAVIETLEERQLLSTFVVTNNGDDPATVIAPLAVFGTLRDAILLANANPGSDTIAFNIPGSPTIHPLTALPYITGPTLVDGTTQPGVVIDGTGTAPDLMGTDDGLRFTGGSSTVRGLSVTGFQAPGAAEIRFTGGGSDSAQDNYIGLAPGDTTSPPPTGSQDGIVLESAGNSVTGNLISRNISDGVRVVGDNNTIQGNLIGTTSDGTAAQPNGDYGILIDGASGTLVGGTTASQRNVISGNGEDGVNVNNPGSGNVISGNYIGVDVSGEVPLGNQINGVTVTSASPMTSDVLIGGTAADSGNVISANFADGIDVRNVSGVSILGNDIGVDPSGQLTVVNNQELGNNTNGISVLLGAENTAIGGAAAGAGNVISGNFGDGVFLDSTASGNSLQGNDIGTDSTGTAALGNFGNGVTVLGHDNQIGTPTSGNTIAYNDGNGIAVGVSAADATAINNAIRGNNIFLNGELGIDLGSDGVTMNDAGDADDGPNHLQNFPVLTSVTLSSNTATINGTLNSHPDSTYVIDFFASQIWDTTHYGEGQKYLGSITVTTDDSGNASFTATMAGVPAGFNYFAATATDSAGNTSEFAYDPVAGTEPAGSQTSDPVGHARHRLVARARLTHNPFRS